ncbi:MAG: YbaB/EbfC family nucleoid-associated protein [Anaerolinea sp.]|nr:YbaB/EbfC family nucleoid-associated protein [Anaerolinea sp.]
MAKGFNRPMGGGGMGAGGGMMSQLKKMQEQMAAAQEQLAEETVIASVGGVIKITMTGDQQCKAVTIDPALLKDADAEMLQDLVLSAINAALDQSRELAAQKMGPLSGGLSGLGF